MTWRFALDQLKQYEADLLNIKSDLKNAIDSENPKDLLQIQRRTSDLKEQIKDSEVFSKYLVHKELFKLRFRDINKNNELMICKTEEEKIMIRKRLENINHSLDSEFAVIKELEDFKLKHDKEISEIKSKHKEDEAKYEKEKKDLLNQRIEIEYELKEIKKLKDQYEEQTEDMKLISYKIHLNFKLRMIRFKQNYSKLKKFRYLQKMVFTLKSWTFLQKMIGHKKLFRKFKKVCFA